MPKSAKIAIFIIFILPFLILFGWYSISFLPYLNDMRSVSSEGSKIKKSASKSLYTIALAGETKVGIRSYAIKAAYTEFVFKKEHSRHLKWALNNLLWFYSSFIHFNDKDVFNIWLYFAPFEGGYGLDKSSMHYFNKPLSELSDREYATLVAIVRSPSRYKPGSSKTEKRVDSILLKVKGS